MASMTAGSVTGVGFSIAEPLRSSRPARAPAHAGEVLPMMRHLYGTGVGENPASGSKHFHLVSDV